MDWLAQERMAMAARSPRAMAKVMLPDGGLREVRILPNPAFPDGSIAALATTGEYVRVRWLLPDRWSALWTRHMLGVREAERDLAINQRRGL